MPRTVKNMRKIHKYKCLECQKSFESVLNKLDSSCLCGSLWVEDKCQPNCIEANNRMIYGTEKRDRITLRGRFIYLFRSSILGRFDFVEIMADRYAQAIMIFPYESSGIPVQRAMTNYLHGMKNGRYILVEETEEGLIYQHQSVASGI